MNTWTIDFRDDDDITFTKTYECTVEELRASVDGDSHIEFLVDMGAVVWWTCRELTQI